MPTVMPQQRWERPEVFAAPPGHWKRQLPGKILAIGAKGDVQRLQELLDAHPEYLSKRGSHGRTLLWEATRKGRAAAVRYLLDRGADVSLTGAYNSETHVQVTPYCAARYYGHEALAGVLWAQGPVLDVFRAAFLGDHARVEAMLVHDPSLLNAEDPNDEIYCIPLLSFAVAGGHAELTDALIRRGAMVAPYSAQLLHLSTRIGRHDLLDLLVHHGADPRAMVTSYFVDIDDLDLLRRLLEMGAPVNRTERNGFPPLVFLSRGDKPERPDKLALLLAFGAKVNAPGPQHRTALHYAAAGGHIKIIELLLAHGADRSLVDDAGRTALDLARERGQRAAMAALRAGSRPN